MVIIKYNGTTISPSAQNEKTAIQCGGWVMATDIFITSTGKAKALYNGKIIATTNKGQKAVIRCAGALMKGYISVLEDQGEADASTTAVLGKAILGKAILGYADNRPKLATPTIRLVSSDIKQLSAPFIRIETTTDIIKLGTPEIRLEVVEDEPEIPDTPEPIKLDTPIIYIEADKIFGITCNLTNVTASPNNPTTIKENAQEGDCLLEFFPNEGYELTTEPIVVGAMIEGWEVVSGETGKIGLLYIMQPTSDVTVTLAATEKVLPKLDTPTIRLEETPSDIITFTIDGAEYQADDGMTWQDWCASKYNTIGAYVHGGSVYEADGEYVLVDELMGTEMASFAIIIDGDACAWRDANADDPYIGKLATPTIRLEETSGNTITFTIDGTEYQAEEGMTWSEWCASKYNTIGAYINDGIVYEADGEYTLEDSVGIVSETDAVNAGEEYFWIG